MSRTPTKPLLIIVLLLFLLNAAMVLLDPTESAPDLRGEMADPMRIKMAVLFSLVFVDTALGFILGALLALIPYKKLSYGRKYLAASLLALVILHLIFAAVELNYLLGI